MTTLAGATVVRTVPVAKVGLLLPSLVALFFLSGALVMAYNLWRTARGDVHGLVAEQPRAAAAPSGSLSGPVVDR